jgi:UDP-N-acetylglucosamine:LPS N-acetylglucosamine transferase
MQSRILAVASGGGHWKQLILLSDAFRGHETKYITTIKGLPDESGITNYDIVKDSNKNEKLSVIFSFYQIVKIVLTYKPTVVVTTGASPGLLAIICGRLIGAKTIWIDSIANAEELSLGGKLSKRFSKVVLSQWQHLADGDTVIYKGSVF